MADGLLLITAVADSIRSYGDFPLVGARGAIWIAAQVHLMFAAFVLGVPMFAVVAEAIGIFGKDPKYDGLPRNSPGCCSWRIAPQQSGERSWSSCFRRCIPSSGRI